MTKDFHLLETILENIEDGIYVIDTDYRITYLSQSMAAMFGGSAGEKCHRVINDSGSMCPWCRAVEVFSGEGFTTELYIPKVDKTFYLKSLPITGSKGKVFTLCIFRDVTGRKKREARLKASEERYRNLFNHVEVGVYISSKEGKFLDVNTAMLKMLGYDGKKKFLAIDIIKDLYLRPEDRKKFQEMIERDGRVIDYEVEFKRADNTPVTVLLTSHVRYDDQGNVIGYEGIVTDQSHRYLMEQRLRQARDFMNEIIGSSPNPIMAADLKGNIIIWNRAAEETLGYSSNQTVKKMNITRIYPKGVAHEIMKMIRSPGHGGVGMLRAHPMLYVRQDGEIIDGMLSAAMIYDDDGNEVATVGSFVDMTERIEMERALRTTQQQLLQSEKLAAMGKLTSQIAHEINNPLYGIMNTLELLKTEVPPDNRKRKLLDMSLSETVRLADMLKKMLSFSKPDQEEKQPIDMNTIIEELLMLHEKQLQEHSIKIKSSLSKGMDRAYASKNQMRQVFLNMIANARDAMIDGGVMTFETLQKNDGIIIRISDTGHGINEEHISKIFESFFTTKDSVKGVGLGLSVCYGFIKEHGGDIKVESSPGIGTTFTITLPVYKPSDDTQK